MDWTEVIKGAVVAAINSIAILVSTWWVSKLIKRVDGNGKVKGKDGDAKS